MSHPPLPERARRVTMIEVVIGKRVSRRDMLMERIEEEGNCRVKVSSHEEPTRTRGSSKHKDRERGTGCGIKGKGEDIEG